MEKLTNNIADKTKKSGNTALASEFLLQFSALHAKLAKRADAQLSYHGISFTEYQIMHYLHDAPQKTLPRIHLAEKVGISASGVTRLLAPMEKNRITEKEVNPRDARMSLVKLSKVGQQLYKDASVSIEHGAVSATERLTDTQLEKLCYALTKIV